MKGIGYFMVSSFILIVIIMIILAGHEFMAAM